MLRIALWLNNEMTLRPGDRVAICLPKSLETVQLVYGVLAAGAAYVPLPIQEPVPRLLSILTAIDPRLLITVPQISHQLAAHRPKESLPPIRIVEPAAGGRGLDLLLSGTAHENAVAPARGDDLAAVFFTSGSTGEPKGVMWSQACLARTIAWARKRSAMSEKDKLISLASLQYTTALDVFFPLASGCSVHLLSDREAQFADHIVESSRREGITIWSLSATTLRLLLENGGMASGGLDTLRRVEFFGESLAIPVLRRLMAILPQAEFVNIYGATEAYDMLSYPVPRPLPPNMEALPLGRASWGNVVTLCDESGTPVPPGAIGEICVRSERTMLGYWNDPVLTAARRLHGKRDSYRTGDLAVEGDDGLLKLVGRTDNVVKLRGHRFDLGEIEAVLKSHAPIRDAVAVPIPMAGDTIEIIAVILAGKREGLESELKRLCRSAEEQWAGRPLLPPEISSASQKMRSSTRWEDQATAIQATP